MKLNGSESFISSMLSRMINPHTALFFFYHFTGAAQRGSKNASCPVCIFKGGHYFQRAKEKIKTALFSDSRWHPCPFEIGHAEVWGHKTSTYTKTNHGNLNSAREYKEKLHLCYVCTAVVYECLKKREKSWMCIGCVWKRKIQRERKRGNSMTTVDYGYLRAPVVHSCCFLFSIVFQSIVLRILIPSLIQLENRHTQQTILHAHTHVYTHTAYNPPGSAKLTLARFHNHTCMHSWTHCHAHI